MAQCIWAMLLNAVTLGIIFARISHPKQRGRTVFLSDSAVIARRDGILKFMFRVADIRQTQVQQGCWCPAHLLLVPNSPSYQLLLLMAL